MYDWKQNTVEALYKVSHFCEILGIVWNDTLVHLLFCNIFPQFPRYEIEISQTFALRNFNPSCQFCVNPPPVLCQPPSYADFPSCREGSHPDPPPHPRGGVGEAAAELTCLANLPLAQKGLQLGSHQLQNLPSIPPPSWDREW